MATDLLTTIRSEIKSRMDRLEPAVEEYEGLRSALDALGARGARSRGRATRAAPTAIDAAGQAILAALEHGSHTVAELGIVTALPAGRIRESVRGLRSSGKIVTTEREGRTAYALTARVG